VCSYIRILAYCYGTHWNEQRRKARKRDDYTCQGCGITEAEQQENYGCQLEVHHIKPARYFDDYETANALSNLVSLCTDCHQRYEELPNQRAKKLITE